MTTTSKAFALLRPGTNFAERIRNKLGVWMDRGSPAAELEDIGNHDRGREALTRLGLPFGSLEDEVLKRLENRVLLRRNELPTSAPFGTFHNGTETLGRLCYAACRALRPKIVVETGVAYG